MEFTGYTIPKNRIIDYPPELLKTFYAFPYEWIDNLHFGRKVEECVDNPEEYLKIAKEIFLEAGWAGDGQIQLMWIPPFMFDGIPAGHFTKGITIWHVKQENDGTSWIISPIGSFKSSNFIIFERDTRDIKKLAIQKAQKSNKHIVYVK
jgi:hypothetical protein